ncbi:hypothetical protein G6514_006840 [Epicoccum nigrum]|nr:hypothetical protein G6514_006840 [Epicoccum nigrum]
MAPYTEQVLLCTGKADWASNLEDDGGDTATFVKGLKSVIGKGGEAFDPFTNVLITASSLPASPAADTTTAYLFPSFQRIPAIRHDASSFRALAAAYLKPEALHPMHAALAPAHRAALTRDPAAANALPAPDPVTHPVILICGHGGRDARCGAMGPVLQRQFEEVLARSGTEALVAQISHIGGHKYAGNVIVYLPPGWGGGSESESESESGSEGEGGRLAGCGIWYGRVGPEQVEGVVAETVLKGRVVGELLRGGVMQGGGNVGRLVEAQLKEERGEGEARLRLRPRARAAA